jgi:threonine dehydrogenase-like Zn-dependent dehydrogenase
MKSLVWEGPRRMALHHHPVPAPQPGEVVIRVAFAGICGSELSGYLGHNALRVPPLVMGHEFSGLIAALGEGVGDDLAQGRAVTVNPLVYCGECAHCRAGLNQLCAARKLIGAHRPGAFAEFVSVPAKLVAPLPLGMSLRTGALAEPAAVGVRIGEMAGPLPGETALVMGAGPIGLLALQALFAQGTARVFIADLDGARRGMGADLGGEPLDPRAVVDAVGAAATRAACVAATRSAGLVLLSGLHEETSPIPAADVIRRELVLRGCFAYSPANFAEALRRLADGGLRLDPWIVEAPLAEGGAWFDRLVEAPGAVAKVLLIP